MPVYRRVWYFKGETPRGVFFWSNKKLSLIGALLDGKKVFYEWHQSLNTFTFKIFIAHLIDTLSPHKNYVFLLDNIGYHKTSCITNYLKKYPNIKIEYVVTSKDGRVDQMKIEKFIENWNLGIENCTFWVSGPPAMVDAMEVILDKMDLRLSQVRSEKFTGY